MMADLRSTPDASAGPVIERSILISIAFWMCLFTSAALLASVSLAPRIVEWHSASLTTLNRQQQMVRLERQIQQLEKLTHALEFDSHLRRELDEGQVSLDELVSLNVEAPNVPLTVPWFIPVLKAIAVAGDWRRRILWLSAGLCVFAFVVLRDTEIREVRTPE